MNINVLNGDITRTVSVDAIVTLINPGGMWFGGVDGAIMRVAGNSYHQQASNSMPLRDGQVVVAKGNKRQHNGNFNDVIFVVDALEKPIGTLTTAALEAAKQYGYKSVAFPAMRTGVMLDAYPSEPDALSTIRAIGTAVKAFFEANRRLNLDVYFIVYSDANVQRILELEAPKFLPR